MNRIATENGPETEASPPADAGRDLPRDPTHEMARHASWFQELDAWTEYWDVYHPETRGRYYFGDGDDAPGLLSRFLPRDGRPPALVAWSRMALGAAAPDAFRNALREPRVAEAILEVDALIAGIFARHFDDAADPRTQADYLAATLRFATDRLPPAPDRDALISEDDPRKPTAGRHRLEGDLMWFAWGLHGEAAHVLRKSDRETPRRALLLAGVAIGCPADFAWRGHRRTREEYGRNAETERLLTARGLAFATDIDAAIAEIHALYRIREWGHEG